MTIPKNSFLIALVFGGILANEAQGAIISGERSIHPESFATRLEASVGEHDIALQDISPLMGSVGEYD